MTDVRGMSGGSMPICPCPTARLLCHAAGMPCGRPSLDLAELSRSRASAYACTRITVNIGNIRGQRQ